MGLPPGDEKQTPPVSVLAELWPKTRSVIVGLGGRAGVEKKGHLLSTLGGLSCVGAGLRASAAAASTISDGADVVIMNPSLGPRGPSNRAGGEPFGSSPAGSSSSSSSDGSDALERSGGGAEDLRFILQTSPGGRITTRARAADASTPGGVASGADLLSREHDVMAFLGPHAGLQLGTQGATVVAGGATSVSLQTFTLPQMTFVMAGNQVLLLPPGRGALGGMSVGLDSLGARTITASGPAPAFSSATPTTQASATSTSVQSPLSRLPIATTNRPAHTIALPKAALAAMSAAQQSALQNVGSGGSGAAASLLPRTDASGAAASSFSSLAVGGARGAQGGGGGARFKGKNGGKKIGKTAPPPQPKEGKKRVDWSKGEPAERMRQAIQECREIGENGRQSWRSVARKYGISWAVLYPRLSGKIAVDASLGAKSLLSKEMEQQIYEHCCKEAEMGRGLDWADVKKLAVDMARLAGIAGFKATDGWARQFQHRFPQLQRYRVSGGKWEDDNSSVGSSSEQTKGGGQQQPQHLPQQQQQQQPGRRKYIKYILHNKDYVQDGGLGNSGPVAGMTDGAEASGDDLLSFMGPPGSSSKTSSPGNSRPESPSFASSIRGSSSGYVLAPLHPQAPPDSGQQQQQRQGPMIHVQAGALPIQQHHHQQHQPQQQHPFQPGSMMGPNCEARPSDGGPSLLASRGSHEGGQLNLASTTTTHYMVGGLDPQQLKGFVGTGANFDGVAIGGGGGSGGYSVLDLGGVRPFLGGPPPLLSRRETSDSSCADGSGSSCQGESMNPQLLTMMPTREGAVMQEAGQARRGSGGQPVIEYVNGDNMGGGDAMRTEAEMLRRYRETPRQQRAGEIKEGGGGREPRRGRQRRGDEDDDGGEATGKDEDDEDDEKEEASLVLPPRKRGKLPNPEQPVLDLLMRQNIVPMGNSKLSLASMKTFVDRFKLKLPMNKNKARRDDYFQFLLRLANNPPLEGWNSTNLEMVGQNQLLQPQPLSPSTSLDNSMSSTSSSSLSSIMTQGLPAFPTMGPPLPSSASTSPTAMLTPVMATSPVGPGVGLPAGMELRAGPHGNEQQQQHQQMTSAPVAMPQQQQQHVLRSTGPGGLNVTMPSFCVQTQPPLFRPTYH